MGSQMPYVIRQRSDNKFNKGIELTNGTGRKWKTFSEKFLVDGLGHKMTSPPRMMEGFRYPKLDFIPEIKCHYNANEFHPFMLSLPGYCITQAVIDIIEDIEPGVHQYFPIKHNLVSGEPEPEPYFLFNVCAFEKTLDYERSAVTLIHQDKQYHELLPFNKYRVDDHSACYLKSKGHLEPTDTPEIFCFADKVAGRAAWKEYGYETILGDEFVRRVLEIGGFGCMKLVLRIGTV